MHRSTQLYFYCSGGERSVKRVRPALEMEESKEEQRGVIRFLVAGCAGTHEIHRRMSADYGKHRTSLASGRRHSEKDAHHCKTICAWDRPNEPLRLM